MNKKLLTVSAIVLYKIISRNNSSKDGDDVDNIRNNDINLTLANYKSDIIKNVNKSFKIRFTDVIFEPDYLDTTNKKIFRVSELSKVLTELTKLNRLPIHNNFELFLGSQTQSLFQILNIRAADIKGKPFGRSKDRRIGSALGKYILCKMHPSIHSFVRCSKEDDDHEWSQSIFPNYVLDIKGHGYKYYCDEYNIPYDCILRSPKRVGWWYYEAYYKKNSNAFDLFSNQVNHLYHDGQHIADINHLYQFIDGYFQGVTMDFNIEFMGIDSIRNELWFKIPTTRQTFVITPVSINRDNYFTDNTDYRGDLNHFYINSDEFCIYGDSDKVKGITNAIMVNKIIDHDNNNICIEFKRTNPFQLVLVELNTSIIESKFIIKQSKEGL